MRPYRRPWTSARRASLKRAEGRERRSSEQGEVDSSAGMAVCRGLAGSDCPPASLHAIVVWCGLRAMRKAGRKEKGNVHGRSAHRDRSAALLWVRWPCGR
eukprot:scaffold238082_cov27-Tisochrysis_lutea.AAC.1